MDEILHTCRSIDVEGVSEGELSVGVVSGDKHSSVACRTAASRKRFILIRKGEGLKSEGRKTERRDHKRVMKME